MTFGLRKIFVRNFHTRIFTGPEKHNQALIVHYSMVNEVLALWPTAAVCAKSQCFSQKRILLGQICKLKSCWGLISWVYYKSQFIYFNFPHVFTCCNPLAWFCFRNALQLYTCINEIENTFEKLMCIFQQFCFKTRYLQERLIGAAFCANRIFRK